MEGLRRQGVRGRALSAGGFLSREAVSDAGRILRAQQREGERVKQVAEPVDVPVLMAAAE